MSKLERREDLYLSTLRGYVEALGGKLELAAVFPDGRIAIATKSMDAIVDLEDKEAFRRALDAS